MTVKRRVALLALMMALAACTTTRTTKCVSKEQYGELAAGEPAKVGDQLTGDAAQDIKPVSGSAIRLRAWGRGLLDVLGGCVSE